MMKRTTILLALFALSLHGMAQVRFLDIYQNGKITRSLATTDVDSINVSGDGTSRMVNFFQGSNLINSYRASTVDSIKVYRPELEPLVYMGIVAFNQELYEKPIGVLSLSSVNSYKSFVSEQSMKDGTLLYYGVDDILDMLTSYDFETKLKKVYLVTFTDGLDQGSLMMNWDYSSSKEYLAAVSRRIRNTRVQNLPITAYSLGLRGSDVTDYAMFQNNLKQLASSDDKAFEVNSMSDVRTRLREIASTINSSTSTTSTTNTQTLRMKIPGVGNGTRICFTFDGNDPTSSSIYIEGTFNLQDRTLTNIVYRGISGVTTGTTVQGIQDGIFVTFTFNFVLHQAISGSEIVPTKNIREYYKGPTATSWQRNSEFTPANNAQTDTKTTVTVKRSGAAVFLLLDCSSSLSSQFSDMKSYANEFIQYIADNTVSNTVSAPDNVKAELDFVDDAFQINVRWNAVKYASSYNVYRSYSSSGTFTKVAEGVKTASWTDDSPLSGYNYYKVEAVGYGLTSPRSSASNGVNCVLSAPINVTAALDDETLHVNVTWDAVKYAQSYNVYRSSSSSGTYEKVAEGVKTSSWSDESPLSGFNYYKVEAVGYGLTSPRSSASNGVNCVLSAPINVTAALVDETLYVNVTWDAVKYAQSYNVYRSNSSSGTFTKVAEGVKTASWTDDSPLSGYNYYKVEAVGYGLTSPRSSASNGVNCVLSAPINVTAALDDETLHVNVTWDAVKYAQSYNVYRSSSSSGTYEKVAEGVKTSSWSDESPLSGFNYYKVEAVGYGLTSPRSSAVGAFKPFSKDMGETFLVNGVSFNMIKVSGGTFLMGKSADGNDVTPVHNVTLSDYYIGETEVTQELWQAVMGSNPSYFYGNKMPVQQVNWNDCQTFIQKLNQLTGKKFRLPTEAEWEFAAKGGTKSKDYTYSGSDAIDDVAWYGDVTGRTHEVATKAPNELGIYDMSGNVWEWCRDWYDSYSSSPQTNPTGPSSGSFRVYRGGCWYGNASYCRTAFRSDNFPTFSNKYIGLRLAQ